MTTDLQRSKDVLSTYNAVIYKNLQNAAQLNLDLFQLVCAVSPPFVWKQLTKIRLIYASNTESIKLRSKKVILLRETFTLFHKL